MKIPPLEIGQVVAVEWADSKAALGWSYNLRTERKPGYISSVGYVVQRNKECLTISTSIDAKKGASLDDFSIPVGCIKKIEVIPGDWSLHEEG